MRTLCAGLLVSVCTHAAALHGVVTNPDGAAVPNAAVIVKNAGGRGIRKTVTSASGNYAISRLAAGMYTLSVPEIGVTLAKFERRGVALKAADDLRLDVRLEWGVNLGTPGDDPLSISEAIRRQSPPPSGPVPRTAEGRPDLSGVWNGMKDPNPEEPAFLPWAREVMKQREKVETVVDNPAAHCLPGLVPTEGPGIYKLVQTPAMLLMIFEDVVGYRQIYLDGRPHPKDWSPSWHGHSIGHWERDTLVVDSTGFNDRSWLGLFPHTEQLHMIERFRRRDLGHLELEITIEDPGTFTKPWKRSNVWELAPNQDVLEYVCNENNRDVQHLHAR
jgi:hypothetical protein